MHYLKRSPHVRVEVWTDDQDKHWLTPVRPTYAWRFEEVFVLSGGDSVAIKEIKRYRVKCDGCGRWLLDMFGLTEEAWTRDDAVKAGRRKGWYTDGERILCEDCGRGEAE